MQLLIDGFNYRAWHYKSYHMPKIGSHLRASLTIQYLNQVFDNKEQLINIDIVYLFSFSS